MKGDSVNAPPIRTAVPAPGDDPVYEKRRRLVGDARARIVAALNLTPLVPPNADTETLNIVEDAWSGLHELALLAMDYEREARDA